MILKPKKLNLYSLVTYKKDYTIPDSCYDSTVQLVAKALFEHVINCDYNHLPITYLQLSEKINGVVDHRNLDKYLGKISEACQINGLPLVSCVVINQ